MVSTIVSACVRYQGIASYVKGYNEGLHTCCDKSMLVAPTISEID